MKFSKNNQNATGGVPPLLTPEEVRELGMRSQAGDAEATKTLVERNLRLVPHTIRTGFSIPEQDMESAISDGYLGLIEAAERFDPRTHPNNRFSTYASIWIRRRVFDGIMERQPTRIPKPLIAQYSMLRLSFREFYRDHDRAPTVDELSVLHPTLMPHIIARLWGVLGSCVSLQAPVGENDGSLEDIIPDESSNAIDAMQNHLQPEEIEEILSKSIKTPRDRMIVLRRFGFVTGRTETLDDLAAEFGVTRERIRQVLFLSLRKMRRHLERNPLFNQTGEIPKTKLTPRGSKSRNAPLKPASQMDEAA
jgi:RNA polymerase sigma factor (sigma-70 family)